MGERDSKSPAPTDGLPELPLGMTVDDLRFVHPLYYRLDMATKGWQVLIQSDIGGNPAQVSYSLERGVSEELDVEVLKRKIGIIDDEGQSLAGYYLGVANSKDAERSLGRKIIGDADILNEDGSSIIYSSPESSFLLFNFTGFPTSKTMEVLQALEKEFLPQDFKPMHLELVASVDVGPKSKTIFERVKDRLGIRGN